MTNPELVLVTQGDLTSIYVRITKLENENKALKKNFITILEYIKNAQNSAIKTNEAITKAFDPNTSYEEGMRILKEARGTKDDN